jgi:hypothetical protein
MQLYMYVQFTFLPLFSLLLGLLVSLFEDDWWLDYGLLDQEFFNIIIQLFESNLVDE